MTGTSTAQDRLCIAVLGLICGALYLLLPRAGDIWWMDASRHALNGAFVLDLVKTMPIHHPSAFAFDYYRQWPALTILFYPPLFYAALALSYAVFGVSEASALIPELFALFALGWGAYRLARTWLDEPASLAVAVLTIGAPEVCFWGRQVMLDVPAYALVMWAAVCHLRFLKGGPARDLFLAVLFAVAAVYTKYNAAFFVGPMAVSALTVKGWRFAWSRTALVAAALGLVTLAPLLVIFFGFASYNLSQAAAVQDMVAPRWSVAGLTYYLRIMPEVLTWPLAVLGLLGFLATLARPMPFRVLPLSWALIGFGFYTMIAVKEPRHILLATFPLALAAVMLLDRLLARFAWRGAVPLVLSAGILGFSITGAAPTYVTGMRQAALEVAAIAPKDSNVAFWGRLDGTFIYAMRAYTNRPDLGVVRLDKLLLGDVAISLERGYTEKPLTPDAIADQLRDLHAQYVVSQTVYGANIGVIGALDTALHSPRFREVKRIRMTSNAAYDYVTELVIYRLTEDVPPGRVAPSIDIKVINKSF
jgi:4-amino-4-deoxy-L-arabinose transferase-like glycosyltransferase